MVISPEKLLPVIPLLFALASCGGGGGGGGGNDGGIGTSGSGGTPVPSAQLEEATRDGVVTFSELNRTIMSQRCVSCHSNFSQESGIRPHIIPGNPEGSRLFLLVQSGEMPRTGSDLTTEELEVVRTYIEGTSGTAALSVR